VRHKFQGKWCVHCAASPTESPVNVALVAIDSCLLCCCSREVAYVVTTAKALLGWMLWQLPRKHPHISCALLSATCQCTGSGGVRPAAGAQTIIYAYNTPEPNL
jgi:hypothetical protein